MPRHILSVLAALVAFRAVPAQTVVIGRVLDSATGRPVAGAHVWAPGAPASDSQSDSTGAFTLTGVSSAINDIVAARQGYAWNRRRISAARRQADTVPVLLRRLSPPCCQLAGAWDATFALDSAGVMHRAPTARVGRGRITFETAPTRKPVRMPDDTLIVEIGLTAIDFTPFVGGSMSWPMSAEGYVDFGDSVLIRFNARIAHGAMADVVLTSGMALRGAIQHHPRLTCPTQIQPSIDGKRASPVIRDSVIGLALARCRDADRGSCCVVELGLRDDSDLSYLHTYLQSART
ncbi:MAG TPA: carboxypeptidase-like regulatory domain-containing protein [Vicinamibacterales bacterium]|nr:carboxypeptidase-like regulatory domain-containing protein [Vicinamibacterales bacterium]